MRRVDLRQPGLRDLGTDRRQLAVEAVSRAARRVDVAVRGDRVQRHGGARRVARVARGDADDPRERIYVPEVEPPGNQRDERRLSRCRDGRRAVVADQRNAGAARVEPHRVRPDHRARHAAVPALEDLAVLVDEEVVANVVPAVGLNVVEHDRPHDRGRLARAVAVRARGVMDEDQVDAVRVERGRAADRLGRVPLRARDDRRLVGEVGLPERTAPDRAADEERPHRTDAAYRPVLHVVGGAGPVGRA